MLTREVLLYILVGMSGVLAVLIVLIMRKRGMLKFLSFGIGKKEGEMQKPDSSETGPTDSKSIKETLKAEKKDKKEEVPRPETVEEPKPPPAPEKKEPPPAPPAPKKAEPPPPPAPGAPGPPEKLPPPKLEPRAPFPTEFEDEEDMEGDELFPMEEGEIEQGMELEEAADMISKQKEKEKAGLPEPPGKPELPRPEPSVPEEFPEPEEKIGFVGLEEAGEANMPKAPEKKELPPAPPAPKKAEPPPPPAPEPQKTPESPKAGEGKAITTEDIAKSSASLKGQTVAIVGDMKLSSKGADDRWYVLFDNKGTAVVRSKTEIPYVRARILAKVEQTRLGQIYLEVINAGKA
jgi:hypothetical protein